jgi:hypothetical protein
MKKRERDSLKIMVIEKKRDGVCVYEREFLNNIYIYI